MASTTIPNLKLQMSKKIAQLTKVICQLNNENEDRDFDMQELADKYESEIQTVLKDTANRVNSFKQQLEDQRDEQRVLKITKMLEDQYAREKQSARKEIERLKLELSECLAKSVADKEYLSVETEKLRKDVLEKRLEIKALQDSVVQNQKGFDASIEKKESEIAEAIREGNRKYSEMIAKTMDKEDELTSQICTLETKEKQDLETINKLVKEISATKISFQDKLDQLCQDYQQNENRLKQENRGLVSKLETDKKHLELMENKATKLFNELTIAHQAQKQTEELLEETQAELKTMTQKYEICKEESCTKAAQLENLRDQEAQSKEVLQAHKNQIQEMTERLEALTDQSNSVTQAWTIDKENWKSKIHLSELEMTKLESQLEKSQADCDQTKICLAEKSKDLDNAQNELLERQTQLEKLKSEWEMDKLHGTDSLALAQEKAERALKDVENNLEASNQTVAELKKKLEWTIKTERQSAQKSQEKVKIDMELRMDQIAKQHNSRWNKLKAKHAFEQRNLKRIVKNLRKELESSVSNSNSSMSKYKRQIQILHEAQTTNTFSLRQHIEACADCWHEESNLLSDKCKQVLGQMEEKNRAIESVQQMLESKQLEIVQLQRSVADKDSQITQQLREAAANDLSLTNIISQLKEELKEMREKFATQIAVLENELMERNHQALQAQADADIGFQNQITTINNFWKQKSQQSIKKAVDELQVEHSKELERLKISQEEAESLHIHHVEQISQEHAAMIFQLKSEMESGKSVFEEHLRKEKNDQTRTIEKMVVEYETSVAAIRRESTQELQRQQRQARINTEKVLKDLEETNKEEMNGLRLSHQKQVQQLQSELYHARERHVNEQKDTEALWASKMEAMASEKKTQHMLELEEKEGYHSSILEIEQIRWENTSKQLSETISNLESNLERMKFEKKHLEDENRIMEDKMNKTQQALARKSCEMETTVRHMEKETRQDMETQHEMYRKTMREIEMSHSAETEKLREDFQKAMDCEKLSRAKLSEQFTLIKNRFDSRESRHEDICQIKQLEELLETKENEVKACTDQMSKLRKEMLLREDSYNKHFRNGGKADKVLNVKGAMESTKGLTEWLVNSNKRPPVASGKTKARRQTD